jgi:Icc-related predicted phosphoesterase
MDILAFTDIHGDHQRIADLKEAAQHADIAICAGDITIGGHDIESIVDALSNLPCDVYLIHGNHEDPQTLQNLSLITDGVSYIHKQIIDLDDHHLIGYGGEGFSFTTDDFEAFIQNTPIPNNNIILVTHQPPHNTAVDKVRGRQAGNNSFRTFIDAHPVILSLSGHLHENFGVQDTVNDVTYMNPGPEGVILSV